MKRSIIVVIVALMATFILTVLAACGGEASVENASQHSYCRPFPFLEGHKLFF